MGSTSPETRKPRICSSKLTAYRRQAREEQDHTSVAALLPEIILEENPNADITCPDECPGEIMVLPKLPILGITIPLPDILATHICPMEQPEET